MDPAAPNLRIDRLDELAAGDLPFRQEMLTLFEQQAADAIARIGQAVRTGDAETLRFYAHKLKHPLDLLGDEESRRLVRTLEAHPEVAGTVQADYDALKQRVAALIDQARAAR